MSGRLSNLLSSDLFFPFELQANKLPIQVDMSSSPTHGQGSLLSGGKIAHPHSFSPAQMQALAAMLDTFVPSVSYETSSTADSSQQLHEAWRKSTEDEIQAFYQLSASQAGIPSYAAGLMHSKLKPGVLQLIGWVLWLLSTRLGTFVLFGRGSVCGNFPYFQSFVEIPSAVREELLTRCWAGSPYLFHRTLFNGFKIFSVYSYYTKVDEKDHNPTWNAIGYCGPDPVAVDYRKKVVQSESGPSSTKPLESKVIDVEAAGDALPSILEAAGFPRVEDVSHLKDLWSAGSKEGSGGKKIGVKCDVVVVGSGSGGGVAAGVLAKAGYKVLVIEKGKYYAREDLSLLEGPALENMYEGGGVLATDSGSVLILAGATVGGGSAVNWSASFRTPEHVLEEWSKDHGLGLFSSPAYQAAMDAVCGRLGVQEKMPNPNKTNMQNSVLSKGCRELGFHVADAPRNCRDDDHSCGWCGFGCWNGSKQATSETWLVDATSSGAVVLSGCSAVSVLHRDHSTGRKPRRAVGVVASVGNSGDHLYVESKITVVACGSLNTPPLLMKSGLTNPHIGSHLFLHPVQMMWGHFPEEVGPRGNAYEGAIISAISTEVANWRYRGHGCILEVPSMHPGLFSVVMPWISGADSKDRMRRFPRTAHVFALARDKGCGHVGLNHSLDYHLNSDDADNLVAGGDAALRILIAAGAHEVGTHHRDGDRLVVNGASEEEIEAFLTRVRSKGLGPGPLSVPLCSAHQMGSCRMGADPRASAVDPRGETWEVEGLFVADASVFPTAIGINPMITVQSVAYCTAQSALAYLEEQQ